MGIKKKDIKQANDKLSIKGSFEDVIRVSVGKKPVPKKGAKKGKK